MVFLRFYFTPKKRRCKQFSGPEKLSYRSAAVHDVQKLSFFVQYVKRRGAAARQRIVRKRKIFSRRFGGGVNGMRERHAVGNDVFYRFRNVRNASGKRGFIFEIRRRAVRNYGSVVAQKVFSARRAGGRETVGYENNFSISFVFINTLLPLCA